MPWLASVLLKPISSYSCYSILSSSAVQTIQAINQSIGYSVENCENMSSQTIPDYISLLLSLLVRIVFNWEFQNSPPKFPLPFMTNGLTLSSLLQLSSLPRDSHNHQCTTTKYSGDNDNDDDIDNETDEFLKTLYDQTILNQEQEEVVIIHELIEEKSSRVQGLFAVLRKASHLSPIIQKQRPLANEFTKLALAFVLHHSSTSILYVH